MPKFSIDKTQGMGSSEIKVRPLEVNEGSSPKVGHVVITLQDGTQKTITLTQLAGERSYKYFLEVNPMDVPVDPLGSTVNVYVESYREVYVNGQMIGTEEVGYTIQGEPGITVQGDTITIGANSSNMEVVRRATVIQDESGKRVIITITQSAGSSESQYTFTADPMFVTFGTSGGSQAINIVSTKTTTVNGSTGSPVTLDYTASISPGFTWNGTSIQATENNSATELTGTLVLTQSESNLQTTVQITQEAAEVSDEYQFTIDPTSSTIENTGGTLTPTIKSVHITQVGSDMQEVEVGYSWNLDNLPSWITFQDGTFTIAENLDTENPRSVSLQAVQEESSKRVTLSITQHKAEYIFLIRKNQQEEPGTEITFEYSADSGIIDRPDGSGNEDTDSVWLYRSWLNSGLHTIGFDASTDVEWITVVNFPVSDGFTVEDVSEPNKPSYRVHDNDTEEPRSGTVTLVQNHSGKKCYIHINQRGVEVPHQDPNVFFFMQDGSPTANAEMDMPYKYLDVDHYLNTPWIGSAPIYSYNSVSDHTLKGFAITSVEPNDVWFREPNSGVLSAIYRDDSSDTSIVQYPEAVPTQWSIQLRVNDKESIPDPSTLVGTDLIITFTQVDTKYTITMTWHITE